MSRKNGSNPEKIILHKTKPLKERALEGSNARIE